MKIEFIKDHSFFNAKAGDVRNDISQAAMLVGAGYAKLVDAGDQTEEDSSESGEAKAGKKTAKKPATVPVNEDKVEVDAKDEAQS